MAYAAVLSAKRKTERLQRSSYQPSIMKSTYGELCSLESVLRDHASVKGRKLRFDPLEEQIEHVADKIEDLMESYESRSPKDEIYVQQLLHLKQEITSLTEKASSELRNMEEEEEEEVEQAVNSYAVSSRIISHVESDKLLVGLDEELREVMDWLKAEYSRRLEVLSICGMAGIGKTTLAQQAYNHPSTISDFDIQIMVTIGPSFKLREILVLILDYLGVHIDQSQLKLGDDELGMYLRRFLKPRRYLIVLDDVWDEAAWSMLSKFIPLGFVGSRIILTTRLSSVARDAYQKCIHNKKFMNDDDCWNLLRKMVFTNSKESCSFELEKIGKKIAQNCEGLPLMVTSIGTLLCQVEKTVENWKKVAEDDDPLSIGNDDSTSISKSLSLSYHMLPRYLKACFLYMGVFPPSYKISVAELIRFWDIEGLIMPQEDKSIQDIAEFWLGNLISNTLVLVHEQSSTSGKIKTCKIHSVFRNLCIGKAQKEKFCHVMKKYTYSFPQSTNHQQRLCIHNNVMLGIREVRNTMGSIFSVRSLLCLGPHHQYPIQVHLNFELLKVLNALRIRFYTFPHEILKLVRLKFLAIMYDGELPNTISKLRNLEVLIVGRHHITISPGTVAYLPMEIWNLKSLTHLQCMGYDLQDPYPGKYWAYGPVLSNLLSLSGVSPRFCIRRFLQRVPKLKKLGIRIELAPGEEERFSFLDELSSLRHSILMNACWYSVSGLDSFKCVVLGWNSLVNDAHVKFPYSLRKLTLSGCRFSWVSMKTISNLEKLEVLKLRCNAFSGSVWELCEGFLELKFLLLEDLDLKVWEAGDYPFPKLERLIMRHCYKLQEIPLNFGNIATLGMIETEDCMPSVAMAAKEIQRIHQCQYGSHSFEVRIHSSWDDKKSAK